MGHAEKAYHLADQRKELRLPLMESLVSAGFPSPADDYIDLGIDLNMHLIENPSSTFFLRVNGESMTGAGIQNGDLLIIDRSINARPGNIVIAILDGSFTVKRLILNKGSLYLQAENPNYPSINLQSYGDVQIWGVATYSIHSLKKNNISPWLQG